MSGLLEAQETTPPPRWQISPRPILRIGEADGPSEYLFKTIIGALLLPDRIVVADRDFQDVRIFRSDGTFEARAGRSGRGPGEFATIKGIWRTRDGLIGVWDYENRRITVVAPDGNIDSTRSIVGPENLGNLNVFVGTLSNGDVVLASVSFGRGGPGLPPMAPDRLTYRRFAVTGQYKSTLGEHDGLYRFNRYSIPFSPIPAAATDGINLYILEGFEARIFVRDQNGARLPSISVPSIEAPSADDAWSSLEDRLRSTNARLFLQYLERNRVPRGGRLPHVGGLLVDDRGLIWVKAFDPLTDSVWLKPDATWPGAGGVWHVVQEDGEQVATVRMPEGFRPIQIQGDRVLGVVSDSLDVQRIAVHRISR